MHHLRRCLRPALYVVTISLLHVWPTSAGPRTSIPPVAMLCGVRAGFDTMEDLRRLWGEPTRRITGGHPHGRWIWQDPRTGRMIDADGFDYNKRGRIIDQVTLSVAAREPGSRGRRRPIAGASLRWMGSVDLGMTRRQVIAAVWRRLPYPLTDGDDLRWQVRGFYDYSRDHTRPPYATNSLWEVSLAFRNGRLHEIAISAS